MQTTRFCENCGAAMPVGVSICPFCRKTIQDPFPISPPQQKIFTPGVVVAGRYRIKAKIGEGGFGVVYKATDTVEQNRLVALKQITLSALSTREQIEATDAYNREVTLPAKLQHQHLAKLYDHFTDAENWYLALEYIEGQTLEDVLAQSPDGCLPIGEVLHIGKALCDVLGYLHVQNPPLIFRDVKPGNIMLTNKGQIYLIDFGIARRYQVGQSKDTGPLGSPGYAAPEQYGRAQSNQRTDIYGLGATLQTLLTGQDPLEIRAHGLPPNCKIPAELHTLILRMMDPDPNQRPALMSSVNAVLVNLQKRYPRPIAQKPPAPFAWLVPLWMLFIQLVGVVLFHVPLALYLIWSLSVIGVQLFRQYKNWRRQHTSGRRNVPKITLKGVQMVVTGGLVMAESWFAFFYVIIISFGMHSINFQFDSLLFTLFYLAVSFGGWIVAYYSFSNLPQKAKSAAAASLQNQQHAQLVLMHQHIRKHKHRRIRWHKP